MFTNQGDWTGLSDHSCDQSDQCSVMCLILHCKQHTNFLSLVASGYSVSTVRRLCDPVNIHQRSGIFFVGERETTH